MLTTAWPFSTFWMGSTSQPSLPGLVCKTTSRPGPAAAAVSMGMRSSTGCAKTVPCGVIA